MERLCLWIFAGRRLRADLDGVDARMASELFGSAHHVGPEGADLQLPPIVPVDEKSTSQKL
jgi:hypothetical protein